MAALDEHDPNVDELAAERLQWVAGVHFLVLALLTSTTLATFKGGLLAPTPRTLVGSTAVGLLVSLLPFLPLHGERARTWLGALLCTTDVILCSIVVYVTGGAESTFSVTFHLTVIVASFLFGSRGALLSALAAMLCFTAVALALHLGLLAGPADLAVDPMLTNREVAYYLSVNIGGLLLVAVLSGQLAEQERRAGGKLAEVQRATADLAALNDDIVRSLTVGLAATDSQGTVLWINPAGLEVLRRPPSQLVGHPVTAVLSLPTEALGSQAELAGEAPLTRPDETQATLSFRLVPLMSGEDCQRGSLVVFQDVTELRNMRKQVERAEGLAVLGRLAAGIAHELRNPLGSVTGSLEMLQESQNLDEVERRLVDIVLRELERLGDLVSQMLDLARPRPPRPQPTDLVPMLRDIVGVVQASGEAPDLEFRLDLPDSMEMTADPDQLRQLFWNLLRNAAQAAPPHTQVRVTGELIPGERVCLCFADEGTGIPPEEHDRIFEPFFSTKRGGVGMGLAICRQVVEAHGGTLSPRAGAPQGTVFELVLPLRPPAVPADQEAERRRPTHPSHPFLP